MSMLLDSGQQADQSLQQPTNTISPSLFLSSISPVSSFKRVQSCLTSKMHFTTIVSTFAGLAALTAAAPAADAASKCGPAANKPIRDGGFESGKTPPTSGPADRWVVNGFVGSSTYALVKPGSTLPGGGQYAFEAVPRPGPFTSGASGLTLTQTLHTCPGSNYSIQADYRFAEAVDGKCSLKIQYPYKDTVGSITTGTCQADLPCSPFVGLFVEA